MKPRIVVLIIALLSLVAKIYCAATTVGTRDAVFFYQFADFIHDHGLIEMYRYTPFFNHTPLIGWFSEGAYLLADGDTQIFGFYLRLAPIIGDLVGVLALLWLREKTGRPAWWAIGLFAASPVSFAVSGFHGNVDSMLAIAVLLAGVACAADRPALCGLFLGLSCNVKIIPLLLAPVFFFLWWQRGKVWRFFIPATLTIFVGWGYPLFTIPQIFLRDVLGYSSVWGVWGFTYPLRLFGPVSLQTLGFMKQTPEQAAIILGAKLVIVGAILFVAWRRRAVASLNVFQTLAIAWSFFFVLSPGFGPHYLVWLAPCVLVASEKWFGALTLTSSAACLAYYTILCGHLPWNFADGGYHLAEKWAPWMVPTWLVITAYLVMALRTQPSTDSPTSAIAEPALANAPS